MRPISAYVISNVASLNIYDVIDGVENFIVAGVNNDNPKKYKLYHTDKGMYFNYGGTRYYLHEFTRL